MLTDFVCRKNGAKAGKRGEMPDFRGNVVPRGDACPSNMEFFGNVGDFKYKNSGYYRLCFDRFNKKLKSH